MAYLIPPLNAKGFYSLKSPWFTEPNTVYECIAIREFEDFTQRGVDLFELVYEPKGLSKTQFEQDKASGAVIITLQNDLHPTVYVPSSHLLSYPSLDNVLYNHVVLSISLGAIADSLDLSYLTQQISDMAYEIIGVSNEVKVNIAPSDQYITAVQHYTIESARQAAISNKKTDKAKLLEKEILVNELRSVIANYEAILKANNLIPP